MKRHITLTPLFVLTMGCPSNGEKLDGDSGSAYPYGSTEPGTVGGCTLVGETPLALDGTAPNGGSVTYMVTEIVGDHQANMTWADGTGTRIGFEISDPTNARFLDYEVVADASGATVEIACSDIVAVDASVLLTTNDGLLDESYPTATFTSEGGASTFTLDISSPDGTLDVGSWTSEPYDSLSATINASWIESGITGEAYGMAETSSSEVVTVMRFDIGRFGPEGI